MKLRKGIGILHKLKEFVTQGTLRSLYYSFIHPYIDYNLLNWSSAPPTNLKCIELSIKKAVRTILSKNKRKHFLPFFKELNILPLNELIKLRRATYMWKLKNNILPSSLSEMFQINAAEIPNRTHTDIINNTHPTIYLLPQPRLEYAARHITYTGVGVWNNELPNILKQSTSSLIFKKKYQKLLLS